MQRAIRLFLLSIFHFFHRLFYDLARELVVGFCALLLAGLFYYVFYDFLNVEVQSLSLAMRQLFGEVLAWLLLFIAALTAGRTMQKEWQSPYNFARAATYLGEEPQVVRWFWCLRLAFLMLLFYVPAWWVCQHALVQWSLGKMLGVSVGMVLITLASFGLGLMSSHSAEGEQKQPLLKKTTTSPLQAMSIWRLKQMLGRNKPTQICLGLGLACAAALGFFVTRQAPALLSILLAYLGGLMFALALALQVSYDLPYAWVEKNLGVSHELYMKTLQVMAVLLGGLIGLASFTCLLIPYLMFNLPAQEGWTTFAGRIFFVAFVGPFLVPYLVFQIDPRRAGIQVITLILSSLFVATAIYASLFSLALLPFIAYYGLQSQSGRFYRA